MKQIRAGTYQIGYENIDLYLLPEAEGGEFYFCPDTSSPGRMKIGLASENWNDVVGVLLHEAFEYVLTRKECRYAKSCELTRDHAAYQFMFDHCQFSDACSKVGEFMVEVLPKVAAIYNKTRKKKGR